MEPPIVSGTILQNRYHLIRVLGQGGFGRTYLAEDLNRFNEPCALKELIPPQAEAQVLDKSKELFQREASTLYQIRHPQVPEFRATFEQDGRLFLVQDYVEGKTYRDLLNDRLAQLGRFQPQTPPASSGSPPATQMPSAIAPVFSEAEVRQLLQQLLPVLEHIHSKGIIHRDITPDNIILRNRDRVPVLIDFGVVKELATRMQSPDVSTPATTVGKVGYAPSEQIQTGRSYPSSDLYSLAVTAVVLLTGKEPRDLLDNTQLTWNWRSWVNVSDDLARVLERMLSYRPGDRYPSAMEVLQALQTSPSPASAPDPNASRMATVAVGRRPDPEPASARTPGRPDPVIGDPNSNKLFEQPWAVVGIGTALALLTGLTSWALVSTFVNKREPQPTQPIVESPSPLPTETESPSPSPTETESPSPSPTETESPSPSPTPPKAQSFSQRLSVAPGKPFSREGNLRENTTANYIIPGKQDQQLRAFIPSEGVLMTILGPDGQPVDNQATRVQQWQGKLPFTGDYTIQMRTVKGVPQSDYELRLNLTESPKPTPTDSPPPSPSYDTQRVNFPSGESAIQFDGQTTPQKIKRYVVSLQPGQQLTAEVIEGNVTLDIRNPDGELVPDASGIKFWKAQFPNGGDYLIDVIAQKQANFTLSVSKNAPTPPQ
ncbi:MAG TPA: serine/threonine protein kinase [Cyanobacteria bacterium UBA8803]|nr:serine/threonine protein kinase [Cyanobacteria bacterium UBA8803]